MDIVVKVIADWLVFLIVIIGAVTFLLRVKSNIYQRYTQAFLAGLSALVIAKLMSLLYDSGERPFIELGLEAKAAYLNNPGFPSDHALFVATISLIVWGATKNKPISLVLATLALAVCIGRVIALVHSPLDVVGGVLAALIGAWLWYKSDLFRSAKS